MFISINSVGDFLRKLHGFKAFVHYFAQKMLRALQGKALEDQPTTKFLNRTSVSALEPGYPCIDTSALICYI